jgi:peptidoglycan/LPS O-acetylase OafA/YrhL
MNPRSRPLWMPYATQLWTIPVELRCSFITWTVVFGLSRTRPIIRMTIMASLCLYLYARFHPYPPLFIAGAVFAEIYLAREESPDTSVETTGHKVKSGVLFTCALFLLSYPRRGGETTPGYSLLYKLGSLFVEIEPKGTLPIYFFPHIGAMLLVYSVSQSKSLLQPIFTTPLAKYLGKISFALYCVHTPLLNWVGYRIIIFWWTSPLGNNVGWLVGFSMLFVIVIFAADIFNRTVDEPCVRLAKWLENKCLDTACT